MWPTHYIPNQPRLDGVPPPRYYLTTPPYPVELTESLASAAEEPAGGFTPSAEDTAELSSVGVPISGVLRAILVEADAPHEELQSTGIPISGVLRDVLIRLDIGREELSSVGVPISGILRDPLVRYENWPLAAEEAESLISTGRPVSGVLA